MGSGGEEYMFFDINNVIRYDAVIRDDLNTLFRANNDPNCLIKIETQVGPTGRNHSRAAYSLWTMLAVIGGLIYALIGGFGIIMLPISQFCFTLHAAKELYYAKLYKNDLFEQDIDAKTYSFMTSSLLSQ